jgi:uncharacterized protein YqgQ
MNNFGQMQQMMKKFGKMRQMMDRMGGKDAENAAKMRNQRSAIN